MEAFQEGLRCQDVHAGLRGVDPNSAPLAHLVDTRLVGMAGSLAASIRGRELIQDAQMLKVVAAAQLDVDPMAFDQVVALLEEAGLVHSVERKAGKIGSFAESVPFHRNLYEDLGAVWEGREPTDVERQLVETVDRLSFSPVPSEELIEELGLDKSEAEQVLEIGTKSELIKAVELDDGQVLYSPFLGFENPKLIADVMEQHGTGQFQHEFNEARRYQGLPINADNYPALNDAVTRGLILAPTVQRPDGIEQAFASIPYAIDRELFVAKKVIVEKALAILACVRCGEHFGGATKISNPVRILNALLDEDRDYTLGAHSSARRQYKPLFRMQVVDFVQSGQWVKPRLIPTSDNIDAARLARDLIRYGEPLDDRLGDEQGTKAILEMEGIYRTPIQTVHQRRNELRMSDSMLDKAMEALMGRKAL